MIRRNFPLIVLWLVFVAMLDILYNLPRSVPMVKEPEPEDIVVRPTGEAFCGRVVMPTLGDIYVLENSSGRNLVLLEKFLKGRAAGLHFLSNDVFKKGGASSSLEKKGEDIVIGIHLTLDSMGVFKVGEFVFTNNSDKWFRKQVVNHIEQYWRYPKSTAGKLEFWIPIRWKAKI